MEYVCVDARFYFWDGKNGFTVMFSYGLMTWYVFKEHETTGAVYQKKVDPKNTKSPNRMFAEYVLNDYLETLK